MIILEKDPCPWKGFPKHFAIVREKGPPFNAFMLSCSSLLPQGVV